MSKKPKPAPLLEWTITPWKMSGQGTWEGIAPVILVEGREPFYADHPQILIDKLQELHDDPLLTRGDFYTLMGQLKDKLERFWQVGPQSDAVKIARNGVQP